MWLVSLSSYWYLRAEAVLFGLLGVVLLRAFIIYFFGGSWVSMVLDLLSGVWFLNLCSSTCDLFLFTGRCLGLGSFGAMLFDLVCGKPGGLFCFAWTYGFCVVPDRYLAGGMLVGLQFVVLIGLLTGFLMAAYLQLCLFGRSRSALRLWVKCGTASFDTVVVLCFDCFLCGCVGWLACECLLRVSVLLALVEAHVLFSCTGLGLGGIDHFLCVMICGWCLCGWLLLVLLLELVGICIVVIYGLWLGGLVCKFSVLAPGDGVLKVVYRYLRVWARRDFADFVVFGVAGLVLAEGTFYLNIPSMHAQGTQKRVTGCLMRIPGGVVDVVWIFSFSRFLPLWMCLVLVGCAVGWYWVVGFIGHLRVLGQAGFCEFCGVWGAWAGSPEGFWFIHPSAYLGCLEACYGLSYAGCRAPGWMLWFRELRFKYGGCVDFLFLAWLILGLRFMGGVGRPLIAQGSFVALGVLWVLSGCGFVWLSVCACLGLRKMQGLLAELVCG
eukprot:gene2534-1589_t